MVTRTESEEPDAEPIHLLIRFSDKVGAIEDTIEAHREVILKQGAVWFGKMGKALASKHVTRMNEQCKRKAPTHMYLVQGGKGRSQVYRANVLEISRYAPPKHHRSTNLAEGDRCTEWVHRGNLESRCMDIQGHEEYGYPVDGSPSPVQPDKGRLKWRGRNLQRHKVLVGNQIYLMAKGTHQNLL